MYYTVHKQLDTGVAWSYWRVERDSRVQTTLYGKSGRRWKAERWTLKLFRCVENDFL